MAKVLIADDQQAVRQMVRITLSSQGWSILEASDGAQALSVARAERPDLILLDLDLGPGQTGFEVCERLKADAATHQIPVVMLTAFESMADRMRGYSVGATRYLTKPFSPLALIETVGAIVATT